jgi:hypothetical protein
MIRGRILVGIEAIPPDNLPFACLFDRPLPFDADRRRNLRLAALLVDSIEKSAKRW